GPRRRLRADRVPRGRAAVRIVVADEVLARAALGRARGALGARIEAGALDGLAVREERGRRQRQAPEARGRRLDAARLPVRLGAARERAVQVLEVEVVVAAQIVARVGRREARAPRVL